MSTASDILRQSAQTIDDRAVERDQPGGERSMARTVAAFNALSGHALTERDGWLFMTVLKQARAFATLAGKLDDYVDLAAYAALAGECVARVEVAPGILVLDGKPVDVPDWAQWAAQDADGRWYLFESRPVSGSSIWLSVRGKAWSPFRASLCAPNWLDTLIEIKDKP
ncbi:hypothetical protein [Xanthomonas phage NEB7]|nr:hypothetical protein [Xanthomonas phage NEB7]